MHVEKKILELRNCSDADFTEFYPVKESQQQIYQQSRQKFLCMDMDEFYV